VGGGFVRHIYVSSPTRNFNREDGTRAKDGLYSLIDYLDPEATRAFLKITHETYRQAGRRRVRQDRSGLLRR
jgi:hypothetical protein